MILLSFIIIIIHMKDLVLIWYNAHWHPTTKMGLKLKEHVTHAQSITIGSTIKTNNTKIETKDTTLGKFK